jgi:hypothetical protein
MPHRVEQAIFTSQRGERMAGYQLTSRSPGIDDATAVQLSNWGPAHDALETRLARSSINLYVLDGDRVCVSFTQLAGTEYSGRSGGRVYTHSFVLPIEALGPFQFNPFLILRAFRGAGRTQPRREPPETLESFQLVGRAGRSNVATQVGQPFFDEPTCEKLVWALAAEQPVYIAGDECLEGAIEAVLQLPGEHDRTVITFATGLKISPRRPFQLQAVPLDQVLLRQLQRNEHALVVQLPARHGSPTRDTKSVSRTSRHG